MPKRSVSDEKKVVVKSLVDYGMKYDEVQEITGISRGYITRIIREFKSNEGLVDWYRKNKGKLLSAMQFENMALQDALRRSLSDAEIENLTPDQKQRWFTALGTDFGIKYDKERLEEGLSTENVAGIWVVARQWREQRRSQRRLEEG